MSRVLRLSILCHGATTDRRSAAFPADEPLADGEGAKALAIDLSLTGNTRIFAGPELRTRQTADALGLDYTTDRNFCDLDYGHWRGRTLTEISGEQPDNIAAWVSDASAAPHGGESISVVLARVSAWMQDRFASGGHDVIVTHPAVIRAMVIVALGAPVAAFWKLDVGHLTLTDIRSDGRRWALRGFALPPTSGRNRPSEL